MQSQFATFEKYFPPTTARYCFDLWVTHKFIFKIVRSRSGKLGDFRFRKGHRPTITVNRDLNPYAFTVTYLHEVAHLQAFEKYGPNIPPHGSGWKATFVLLLEPLLTSLAFPADLSEKLRHHLSSPKAASCSDPALAVALSRYDDHNPGLLLGEVLPGQEFIFKTRLFKKESTRRTRSVCLEMKTGRKYLISEIARVERADGAPS